MKQRMILETATLGRRNCAQKEILCLLVASKSRNLARLEALQMSFKTTNFFFLFWVQGSFGMLGDRLLKLSNYQGQVITLAALAA